MRASLIGVATLAGILTYCYRQAKAHQSPAHGQVKEDVRRWESEGGNVPAVATPSPAPVPESSFPAGSDARH